MSIRDLEPEHLEECFELANRLKQDRRLGRAAPSADLLAGQQVALLFQKPSLRTRSTFEIAVRELGGQTIEPDPQAALGTRESVADVARNLERWVHAVVIRTFAQRIVEEFSAAAPRLTVINALTDEEHPCQALADFFTLKEHWGTLAGRTIAYIGDGNNVATSLIQAGLMLGVHIRVASPRGFEVPAAVIDQAYRGAREGAEVVTFSDPVSAVSGTDAIYTDVWTSMGHEREAQERRKIFRPYQITGELMERARHGALFLHCLPAHRGEEVTSEVIDGDASVVFDQAENRLHTQKALLVMVMKAGEMVTI